MSNPSITLYQAAWCPYCQRVQRELTELGIPYATVEVPWQKAMREELFRVSGQRGVPTLVDGDVIIPNNDDAIIAYLEGRYGKASVAVDRDQ